MKKIILILLLCLSLQQISFSKEACVIDLIETAKYNIGKALDFFLFDIPEVIYFKIIFYEEIEYEYNTYIGLLDKSKKFTKFDDEYKAYRICISQYQKLSEKFIKENEDKYDTMSEW